MRTVIVRYRTKPDRADENQQLIEKVFAELAEAKPDGLRYASFRAGDDFTHVAVISGGDNPLAATSAFGEFQREIADRCVEGPTPTEVEIVGSYGW